jgi:hypothetical protein
MFETRNKLLFEVVFTGPKDLATGQLCLELTLQGTVYIRALHFNLVKKNYGTTTSGATSEYAVQMVPLYRHNRKL